MTSDSRGSAARWLAVCALVSGGWGNAQGGVTWTQRLPDNRPLPRVSQGQAYDEARGRVVLFGGLTRGPVVLGDTWEWDGNSWLQRMPANSPPARDPGDGMAYDRARQRVVLYGSSGRGDTWEWDGTNWIQRFPATSPGPRYQPAMAYDRARQRIVLFGGQVPPTFRYARDTWEWDGTNWTLRDPASGPGYYYPVMSYDGRRQRVVLFHIGETWEWDGTVWTQRFPATRPPHRVGHVMAWDSARRLLVMFGGAAGGGGYYREPWEWDGVDWTVRVPRALAVGKAYAGMSYDAGRGRMVLFGGFAHTRWGPSVANATLEYHPRSPASYASFGSGCPGSVGVTTLGAAPFRLPWIGDTFQVDVGNVAAGSGVFLVTGLSNTSWRGQPPPLSLAPLGLPAACNALISVDGVAFAFATGTTASFGIPICNCPTLIGTTFHHQALVLDPAGPVVSNAATGVVGGR